MGTVWDFWPLLKLFGQLYDSKFISFYEPWLKGEIDKDKIVLFNEKSYPMFLFPFKIFKLVTRTYKIIKIIMDFKPDIVVTHHDDANMSILPTIFILKKIFMLKKPKFYLWVRNNPVQEYKSGFRSVIINFFYKYGYGLGDKIVVQCEANKNILMENFPILKNKIIVIPNVYDVKYNIKLSKENLSQKEKKIFKNSFVFINIGRLTEQKAQWGLIRCFKKVAGKHKNAKLIILGEGELRSSLEDLIKKLNLEDNVYLLGKQDNPFKFLKSSDCLVLSSLWEGFPNTIFEALSLDLPVISSDCETGPREVLEPKLNTKKKINYPYLGKYGILTKPFKREFIFKTLNEEPLNEEENVFADLMIKMIEDKNLRARYSHGLERAKDFDLDEINIKIENLINT